MNNQLDITPLSKQEFVSTPIVQSQKGGGFALKITSFAEAEAFARYLATSIFVPKYLRNKPADCLAVVLQSQRWEMDAFSVAQKTYFVNDGIGYEAQLINAVIISNAPLKGRPDLEWQGEGENLTCTVSATFIGENEPKKLTVEIKPIKTRNSPLWVHQPKVQLGYYALRAWSRLYCPDVIMGVYSVEERQEMKDITPYDAPQAIRQQTSKNPVEMFEQPTSATQASAPAILAHDDDGVIIEQSSDDSERCDDTADMFAGDTPIDESKPLATLQELQAMPYANQTQIKALCKAAYASIEGGAVDKLDFMRAFAETDLEVNAGRVAALAEYKKITKL